MAKNYIINKLCLVLFLFGVTSTLLGQTSQTVDRLPCIDKTFSIVVHIVLDSLGDTVYEEADILEDLDSLNKNFAPICVSFEICEFRYIDNFLYLEVDEDKQWEEMQVSYNLKNRINVYYVNTILNPAGEGFATFVGINDTISGGIVLSIDGEKGLSHEMGHYFGLKHTFETDDGAELVDGSNCATTGDKICDTPADPNSTINAITCEFTSMVQDANGQYYNPLVNNMMSYYSTDCLCNPSFTREQYKRMATTYLSNIVMW